MSRLQDRIERLEHVTAPRNIVIVGDDAEPAPQAGVRIVRIETGVPR